MMNYFFIEFTNSWSSSHHYYSNCTLAGQNSFVRKLMKLLNDLPKETSSLYILENVCYFFLLQLVNALRDTLSYMLFCLSAVY